MKNKKENYNKEEWGGWKIVSDMLDNHDEHGIYPTGECYQKLYEFVCEQKKKALQKQREEIVEIVKKAVDETTKEHGSSNVYIDMVGEIIIEEINFLKK